MKIFGKKPQSCQLFLSRVFTLLTASFVPFGFDPQPLFGRGRSDQLHNDLMTDQRFAALYMFYLCIPSPDLALPRICDGVESGGHNVPEIDVRRRFGRTLGNLLRLYRPLLDTLHFFDISSDTTRLILGDEACQTAISDAMLCQQLRRQFAP